MERTITATALKKSNKHFLLKCTNMETTRNFFLNFWRRQKISSKCNM